MLPHFDLIEMVKTIGYLGLFSIVFAESGLFIGFFLPGDSLLFTAGFLASQEFLDIWIIIPILIIAAISGDSVGYWTGSKFGGWLMRQKDSFFFKKKYILEAEEFYEKHGGKAILFARFLPIVRTFVPIAAGIASMDYKKFVGYNVAGGITWVMSMTLLGFFLGNLIPDVDKYMLPVIIGIIIISVVPGIIHMRKKNTEKHSGFSLGFRIKILFKKLFNKA